MKAILIARVSTEEQRDAGNSLPAQVVRLERYCQSKNFTILQTCSFDESAYSIDREKFDQIIDFILEQKDKVAVLCDKVDRLSRNVFDKRIALLYERALEDKIELHFVSDGQVITSSISAVEKFQFSMSLGLAKYYSDAISDNVKRAQEQMLRKGIWVSKAPYGYKNIEKHDGNKDIVIDEYQAEVVKKIFELYATGAYSMELLCKKLLQDYNLPWYKGYLSKVISNKFYYGMMTVKGKDYPHRYPPLLDKSLYEAAEKVRNEVSKNPIKLEGHPFIYRGLMQCGDCGMRITPESHKGMVYYHCTQYKGKHGAVWLREEIITVEIAKVLKSIRIPQDTVAEIAHTLDEVHVDQIKFHTMQHERLAKEQSTLTTMIDNLYMDKLKGRITDSEYDKFYQKLRDELTNVSISLEQLQEAKDNYYMTAKYVLDLASRAFEIFVSSEVEEKRLIIKFLFQNLSITSGNIVWELHPPFDLLVKSTERNLWRG